MSFTFPSRRLVSQEETSMVQKLRVPRSRFTGRKVRTGAYTQGLLYPIHIDEVLPGDHFRYSITPFIRVPSLFFPMMDTLRVDTFGFFVPMRILWTNFKRFMGEQPTGPSDSIAFTIPQIVSPAGGFGQFEIYDHFGIPVNGQITAGQTITINALPLRAYNRIWNEWFRDQNTTNAVPEFLTDGPDAENNYRLQWRSKGHDYFTTALPWQQKFTAPTIPLSGDAPVKGIGTKVAGIADGTTWRETVGDVAYPFILGSMGVRATDAGAGTARPMVYADLSAVSGISINTLRQAWLVQSLLERDARGGTRYPESVLAHFDVRTPDFRVQRPEFIGGGSSPVGITPIAQTATGGTGVGSLGGTGTATGRHGGSYAATEHGYIIWLMAVKAELSYQQGLHRLWSRSTRLDLAWPELAGLGEQAVLQQEIYCTGTDAADATVFGYQERYHEYRTMWSDVVGIMRSTAAGTIHQWHLSQQFSAAPVLGSTFIRDQSPLERCLVSGASAVNQQLFGQFVIERDATRPLPVFGTPAAIGRF